MYFVYFTATKVTVNIKVSKLHSRRCNTIMKDMGRKQDMPKNKYSISKDSS